MVSKIQPEPLGWRRAQKIIRKISQNSIDVPLTYHAWDQMELREITMAQILRVLRTGTIYDGPMFNTNYDDWECNMKGTDAGEIIGVMVGIERDLEGLVIITVCRIF